MPEISSKHLHPRIPTRQYQAVLPKDQDIKQTWFLTTQYHTAKGWYISPKTKHWYIYLGYKTTYTPTSLHLSPLCLSWIVTLFSATNNILSLKVTLHETMTCHSITIILSIFLSYKTLTPRNFNIYLHDWRTNLKGEEMNSFSLYIIYVGFYFSKAAMLTTLAPILAITFKTCMLLSRLDHVILDTIYLRISIVPTSIEWMSTIFLLRSALPSSPWGPKL